MKVLITNPPWIFRKGMRKRFGIRAGSRWPFSVLYSDANYYIPYPGFMGYATTYLQSKGIEAEFYDAIAQHHSYNDFFKTVDKFKPNIIIQETSTPSFNIDLKIAKQLHTKYETCLVGPHATAFAEILIELPFVDYILKGGYEYSALEMVQTRRRGIYDFNRVRSLDDLPYPYRDEIIIHRYKEFNCEKKLDFPQLWIYGGRGCAFHCDFCLWVHSLYNNKFTLRGPIKILDEVENMVTKYGFKYIEFDDDCWNLGNSKRLMEIADGLHKIGIPWSIMGRLDTCSKEIFKYLVDKGCTGLRLGVESLSQPLLDRSNKKLKAEMVIDVINYLKPLDVSLFLCFMHYIPGETEDDRLEQNRRIKELGIRSQNPPCIPFPGTPYYESMMKEGFNIEREVQWSEYDGYNIGINLKNMVKRYSEKIGNKKWTK